MAKQYIDELDVKVLRVTEELDAKGHLLPMPDYKVGGVLPYIPQSEDYPVTGLKGVREQLDMLLAALKELGLMESGNKETES